MRVRFAEMWLLFDALWLHPKNIETHCPMGKENFLDYNFASLFTQVKVAKERISDKNFYDSSSK